MAAIISAERPDTPEASALIHELEAELEPLYAARSRHGYSVEKLIAEGVAFFVTRDDEVPVGCGGIQIVGAEYGELKRMYVRPAYRKRGFARLMLDHLTNYGRSRGVGLLRLETGIHQQAAIALYEREGFRVVPPFGNYFEDPVSRCYEKPLAPRSDVTRLLEAARGGDSGASERLLVLVYDELRRMAAQKMAGESAGQTLQATALVHEAWMRLAGPDQAVRFASRAHFFGAAGEAMRRILIERARRRKVLEKGGYSERIACTESSLGTTSAVDELLGVDEALDGLAREDASAASLVKLRYFVGMSMPEAAESMGLSLRSAERLWTFAKAWLRTELQE